MTPHHKTIVYLYRMLRCTVVGATIGVGGAATADFSLSGVVQGEGENEQKVFVPNATVRAFRKGKVVASGRTGERGEYELDVPGRDALDHVVVEKRKSHWHPWAVKSIAGDVGDVRMPVLLLPDVGPESSEEFIEQLLVYEMLFYLSEDSTALIANYQPLLRRMPETAAIEKITAKQAFYVQRKRLQVFALYGIGSRSEWLTAYKTKSGAGVAIVTLDGKQGWYEVLSDNNTPSFGHITITREEKDDNKVTEITGKWHLNDAMGAFTWSFGSDEEFKGTWNDGVTDRQWNGARLNSLPKTPTLD